MSPDRTTITRAEAIRKRKEEEQTLRDKLTRKNVAKERPAAAPRPAATRPAARPNTTRAAMPRTTGSPASISRLRQRYDLTMSSPYRRAEQPRTRKAPAISINMPQIGFGPRWFSFFIALFCVIDLYLMFNLDPFVVRQASISGNQRVSFNEIENVLGVRNQPAALLNPAQIEYNILATFADIESVKVEISLPGNVAIFVNERRPVAAWLQDGQTVWVDARGYAFPPRGQLDGLVTVTATGAPPAPSNIDATQTIGARPFLAADLSMALATLVPHVPEGAALIFDPQYGLGWSDPLGWKVYFGHSNGDTAMKLQVYEAMLAHLSKNNIQPSLISVEYPSAPFYRVEQ